MQGKESNAGRFYGAGTLVLLAGLYCVTAFYHTGPVWSRCFGLFDVRNYYGPNAYFLDVCLARREFPLWNPLIYCGTPFLADPQTGTCYPFQLLRSLLTPPFNPYATALGLHLLSAAHILLGGVGCLRLCREYGLSMAAGLVAAFIFMFAPLNILFYTEYTIFPLVTAWAPWLLWLCHRALEAPGRRSFVGYTAASTLVFGLSSLVAFPQLTLYLGILLAVYAGLQLLLHHSWHPREDSMCWRPLSARTLVWLASVAAGGGMVAAVVLLPAWELAQLSGRPASAGLALTADREPFGWYHLLISQIVYPGDSWRPYGSRAAGIGSILLFIAACWHPRKRDVAVFTAAFFVFTDLMLGPPLPLATVLHQIDPLNITMSPQRAAVFQALALAMAAAFGVDAIASIPRSRKIAAFRIAVLGLAGTFMLAVLDYWQSHAPLFEAGVLVSDLPAATLFTACCAILLKKPVAGRKIIALLVCLEILAWATITLPNYASRLASRTPPGGLDRLQPFWNNNSRSAVNRPNHNLWTLTPAMNGYLDLFPREVWRTLSPMDGAENYQRTLNAQDALTKNLRGHLFAKRSFWLAKQWAAGDLPPKDVLYPSASTVFLTDVPPGTPLPVPEVSSQELWGEPLGNGSGRIELLSQVDEMANVKPLDNAMLQLELPAFQPGEFHSVLSVEFRASERVEVNAVCEDENRRVHFLNRCFSEDTGEGTGALHFVLPDCSRCTVSLRWPVIQREAIAFTAASLLQDTGDENHLLSAPLRTANSVELNVGPLPAARILLFVDSYYPGWNALVDGKPVDIHRANNAFKAIVLAPGSHHLRFEFRSSSFLTGLVVSLSAVLALLLALAAAAWPRTAPETTETTAPEHTSNLGVDNRSGN